VNTKWVLESDDTVAQKRDYSDITQTENYTHSVVLTTNKAGETLLLKWTPLVNSRRVAFLVQGDFLGWISLGFTLCQIPDHPMIGTHAVVGWDNNNGKKRIAEYSLPSVDVSQMVEVNALSISDTQITEIGAQTTLQFTAAWENTYLKTDGFSKIVVAGSSGKYELAVHNRRSIQAVAINFLTGEVQYPFVFTAIHWHGLLMFIAFGILFPFGILFARYAKSLGPLWFKVHMVVQIIGVLIALVAFALSWIYIGGLELRISDTHHILGFAVVLQAVLQAVAGLFRPQIDEKTGKSLQRVIFDVFHSCNGCLLVFLGIVNIFLGFSAIDALPVFPTIFVILLAVICVLIVVFEISKKRTADPNNKEYLPLLTN